VRAGRGARFDLEPPVVNAGGLGRDPAPGVRTTLQARSGCWSGARLGRRVGGRVSIRYDYRNDLRPDAGCRRVIGGFDRGAAGSPFPGPVGLVRPPAGASGGPPGVAVHAVARSGFRGVPVVESRGVLIRPAVGSGAVQRAGEVGPVGGRARLVCQLKTR